jgi:hypothetical protein
MLLVNIKKLIFLTYSNNLKRMYRYNRYSILQEEDSEYIFNFPIHITHLEMHPVALLIKYKNITHLEPHPTSYLIKYMCICNNILYKHEIRPNDNYYWNYKYEHKNYSRLIKDRNYDAYHDGILLQSELESLKNKVELFKEKLENTRNIKYNIISKLELKIDKIKNECEHECIKWLDQIHICNCGKCYNCEKNQGIDVIHPGRCFHYYKIEQLEEDIELNQEPIYDMEENYYEIKSKYERELAKKNGNLRQYTEELDEDYENFSYWEVQKFCEHLRNYKEPVYIY